VRSEELYRYTDVLITTKKALNLLTLSSLQLAVEVIAVFAFALSGLIAAARKKMDAVGVCMVSGVAAFGGGTLRDVLLDRRPFFWVENAYWLWILLALCILAMLFMRAHHLQLTERAIQIPDALGLGLFTALGTQIALGIGLPYIVAILMGVVSASFGGVLRDIFCNQIPKAFSDHQPYAIFAFAGGCLLVVLTLVGMPDWAALLITFGVTTGMRLLALYLDWRIPGWNW